MNSTFRTIAPKWGAIVGVFLCMAGLSGCGANDESAAVTPQPPVSDATKKDAESLVVRFANDVAKADDADLQAMSTTTLKAKVPTISKWLKGPYHSLSGAKDWHYDLTENLSGGKKVVVHAHFFGTDGKTYRTNLTFRQKDGKLQLDELLEPTFATTPTPPKSQGTTKAPGQ